MLGRKKDEKYYLTHYTDEELKAAQEKMQKKAEEDAKNKKTLMGHFRDTMDDAVAKSTETIRKKYRPRWRKICGVETDEEIDYDNPIVSTEWLLCDPTIQRDLIQGRRDKVLARMTEQQQ